jgi:hypothetical protein
MRLAQDSLEIIGLGKDITLIERAPVRFIYRSKQELQRHGMPLGLN